MLIRESKANMKIRTLLLVFFLFSFFISCEKETKYDYTKLHGNAFGTSFNITYDATHDYTKEIDSLFHLVNNSLSTYIPNSDISKVNRGDTTVVVDELFLEVYNKSLKIYQETKGIFDPTIGVLVNAWGFGPEGAIEKPDSAQIKRLLDVVGFDKVSLLNNRVIKQDAAIYFDFNAIAKGFAVDVAGRFLESEGVANYLVEIGGEIRTRGVKKDAAAWRAGIEEPNFDGSTSIQKIIDLKDEAMATSGSYRKFKIDSLTGKKYIHILNAKTGYTSESQLLSVSVIAKLDCADVDGYATALMAMPLLEAQQFLKNHSELRAYLIYSDEQGNLQTFATSNF